MRNENHSVFKLNAQLNSSRAKTTIQEEDSSKFVTRYIVPIKVLQINWHTSIFYVMINENVNAEMLFVIFFCVFLKLPLLH